MADLEVHPAAMLFPLLDGDEVQELAVDIRKNGLSHAIVVHEGKILDGRNRLRACELAGVEPRFTEWAGSGDPTDWVVTTNLYRRHLTTSQRALIAVELKQIYARSRLLRVEDDSGPALKRGRGRVGAGTTAPAANGGDPEGAEGGATDDGGAHEGPSEPPLPADPRSAGARPAAPPALSAARHSESVSAEKAARRAHVSRATVERAQKVVSDGAAELLDAVRAGDLTISRAAELAKLPADQQRAVVQENKTPGTRPGRSRPRGGAVKGGVSASTGASADRAAHLDLTEFKAAYKRGPKPSKRTPLHEVPRLEQLEATTKVLLRAWHWINMEWDTDRRRDMQFALDEAKTMTPQLERFAEQLGQIVFTASGERAALEADLGEEEPEQGPEKTA